MITYVNTVLVSNLTSSNLIETKSAYEAITVSDAGKYVVVTLDEEPAAGDSNFPVVTTNTADKYERIKVGVVTNQLVSKVNYTTGETTQVPVIKWSNVISADSVKSYQVGEYTADTEDEITIDFTSIDPNVESVLAQGGKRVIVRLTFKDLPTRFRKWTESYEYVTVEGDTKTTIAANIANLINKQYKRARVIADGTTANKVILTAMKYTDDDSVDSINWYNKVRFNANIYYTNPAAEGWESKNKNFPKGVTVAKEPGKTYPASAKLVRDRESQAMGYLGILNRGEGTWPVVKPAMVTDLAGEYNYITLEFERMYRTADDLQRRTKETLEIYTQADITSTETVDNTEVTSDTGINALLKAFVG